MELQQLNTVNSASNSDNSLIAPLMQTERRQHKDVQSRKLSERIDAFFTQEDSYSNSSFIVPNAEATSDTDRPRRGSIAYQWTFNYTISYWRIIAGITADMLLLLAAVTEILAQHGRLTKIDQYVLSDIPFWLALLFYCMSAYMSIYQITHEVENYRYSLGFRAAVINACGSTVSCAKLFCYVVHYDLPFPTYAACSFFSGCCFLVGGVMLIHQNKGWVFRPYKLAWLVSWLGGLSGFCFFCFGVASFFKLSHHETVFLPVGQILGNNVGTFLLLIAHWLGLAMWKLEQYGDVFIPQLNRNLAFRKKKYNVLYRDVFFLNLYIISTIVSLVGLCYCFLCQWFEDWIKNFALDLTASFAILLIGSFVHKEPAKPPLSYLFWYVRFYFCWRTINSFIDAYDLSGERCVHYEGY